MILTAVVPESLPAIQTRQGSHIERLHCAKLASAAKPVRLSKLACAPDSMSAYKLYAACFDCGCNVAQQQQQHACIVDTGMSSQPALRTCRARVHSPLVLRYQTLEQRDCVASALLTAKSSVPGGDFAVDDRWRCTKRGVAAAAALL
jgi:hypothetical protein